MKRLIVAPHADDEVLGCGGLLAKYGDECSVVVCAKPTRDRLESFYLAQSVLGYEEVTWLNAPDGMIGDDMRWLVSELDRVLKVVQPDELYLPYPDLHQDHIAAYEAGMRAARGSMDPEHFYVPTVLVYDVAAYSLELRPTGLTFSVFEDISGEPALLKVKAMEAYAEENKAGASEALSVHAASLGHMHRTGAVEQYAAVRIIR